MILNDYLYFKKKMIKDFAKLVPCDAGYISNYLHKKVHISERMAYCISKATVGEVTVETLLANNGPKKPRKEERLPQESLLDPGLSNTEN